jgi:hypothetical protein
MLVKVCDIDVPQLYIYSHLRGIEIKPLRAGKALKGKRVEGSSKIDSLTGSIHH